MPRRAAPATGGRPRVDYRTLAELRYQIRKFLRGREVAARASGIEPQQYLLLLQLKALEDRWPATIGVLAERLQLRHHSTVELIDRLAERKMVERRRAGGDRREVLVELKPAGEAVLRKLAAHSLAELRTEGPVWIAALARLIGTRGRVAAHRRHPTRQEGSP